MSFIKHPLFQKLLSLDLPPEDFVVVGSGPMLAHGIRSEVHDLDIVARRGAWERACSLGQVEVAEQGDQVVRFFDDSIEVFADWVPGEWDVDKLIDGADIFDGIRFLRLESVITWKQLSQRPKDQEHIRAIKDHLRSGRA